MELLEKRGRDEKVISDLLDRVDQMRQKRPGTKRERAGPFPTARLRGYREAHSIDPQNDHLHARTNDPVRGRRDCSQYCLAHRSRHCSGRWQRNRYFHRSSLTSTQEPVETSIQNPACSSLESSFGGYPAGELRFRPCPAVVHGPGGCAPDLTCARKQSK